MDTHHKQITTCSEEFAVIEFEDGMEIIRTKWAKFDENNKMVASYFPPYQTKKEIEKILQEDPQMEDDCGDEDRNPYPIQKVLRYASTFGSANKKMRLLMDLSQADSDDAVNMAMLKKSRHECGKKDFNKELYESKSKISKVFLPKVPFIPSVSANPKSKTQVATHKDGNCNQSENSEKKNTSRQEVYLNKENESPNAASQSEISQKKNTSRQEVYLNKENESPNAANKSEECTGYFNKSENAGFTDGTENINKRVITRKRSRFEDPIHELAECERKSQQQTNNNYPDQRPTEAISFLNRNEDLNIFPARSQHEVDEIEKNVKRSTFYNKMTDVVKQLGKYSTLSITVKNFMHHLLTYEAGTQYAFQGRGEKKPSFKNLRMYKAVMSAATYHFLVESIANIAKWINDWLVHSKQQNQRLQDKAKSIKEKEQRMQIEMEESANEE